MRYNDSRTMEETTDIELTPLELLPVPLFCRIAQYLLVVDYDSDAGKRHTPFICHVQLKRGYALAVCSRRCHELFEESAELFLRCYGPKNYFVPAVVYKDNPASHLAEFYRVKGLEVSFRNECKSLQDIIAEQPMHQVQRDTQFERRLLHQVQKLLKTPFIQDWARHALAHCAQACARILRCPSGVPTPTSIYADAALAAATVSLLEKMIHRNGLLAPNHSLVLSLRCYNLYFLLYLACGARKRPKRQEALLSLLAQIHDSPDSLKYREIRYDYLHANEVLLKNYLNDCRNQELLALLRQSRQATRQHDPWITWKLTKLVYDHRERLGLPLALQFVTESGEFFNSVASPSTDLKWEYSADKWRFYQQKCSSWLRALQR